MSAERMIVNAMQEQPILLLPFFMVVYFIKHAFKRATDALVPNASPGTITP